MAQPTKLVVTLPDLHPGQRQVWDSPARFNVMACGRRWGKTRLGSLKCVTTALQGGRAWWVAPSYPMAMVGWRLLKHLSKPIPGVKVREADRMIAYPNGGSVTVRSADNPDSLRGEGLDLVVLDECAFIPETAWTEALRPTLSDRQGKAIFISTPKGRNFFWHLWQRGLEGGEWQSWQFPTSNSPYILPQEIEAARTSLPELVFEQEYLAVFLEGQGTVFRNLAACMGATEADHTGHALYMGVDWGKQNDWTAISIGCQDCHCEVAHDRFNQIDYSFQRARLGVLADQWQVTAILPERNSIGDPIIEQLLIDGLPILAGPDEKSGFMTTPTTKPQLIENLALAFEREEWQFQADPIWTGELEAYERQISPVTGRSQYSAPAGMHDDTVIARALMVWAATNAASWLLA